MTGQVFINKKKGRGVENMFYELSLALLISLLTPFFIYSISTIFSLLKKINKLDERLNLEINAINKKLDLLNAEVKTLLFAVKEVIVYNLNIDSGSENTRKKFEEASKKIDRVLFKM